ncbi:MAG: zinc metalloprotease HtpX [Candidatus Brocadiales bacterium]
MNYFKTFFLLIILSLLFVWVGGYVGGGRGTAVAFIFVLVMNFVTYWYSDKIVLKMYKAKETSRADNNYLYSTVEELTNRAGLPMPKVYIIPSNAANAFATGRNPNHAAVAVTQGIMDILTKEELKGVLGHELAHVKNRDILIATAVAVIAGAIMMLASIARWTAIFGGFGRDEDDGGDNIIAFLLMAILAPLAALLIQMAISRSREYAADKRGASIAGTSHGLANALLKLQDASRHRPIVANQATAHLFIVKPISAGGFAGLFSTHPPIEERVKRLKGLRVEG